MWRPGHHEVRFGGTHATTFPVYLRVSCNSEISQLDVAIKHYQHRHPLSPLEVFGGKGSVAPSDCGCPENYIDMNRLG